MRFLFSALVSDAIMFVKKDALKFSERLSGNRLSDFLF